MMTVGILLERRGDGDDGDLVLDGRQDLQCVGHGDVDPPRREKLKPVDLRSAHAYVDIEAVLAVRPFGERLVEAAVLGFRKPVGGEHELVQRLRRCSAGT